MSTVGGGTVAPQHLATEPQQRRFQRLVLGAGKDKYFAVTDAIFHVQPDIYGGKIDAHTALLNVARTVGMNEDQFNACISSDAALTALNQRAQDHALKDHVDSTPTFVINGVPLTPGYHPLSDLDAAIAAAH